MIINPMSTTAGGVPLQNPGSGTPGGQMPMGMMRPQPGVGMGGQPPPTMGMGGGQHPSMGMGGPTTFNGQGMSPYGPPQQPPGMIGGPQQKLFRQYAMSQALRGAYR
jgi:transcription elongation regulator 1